MKESATSSTSSTSSTRRERQRAATLDEIVRAARELLAADEDLSLRAVATALGMTSPALYRYVDSHAGLLDLVTRRVLDDVISSMRHISAPFGEADPGARTIASTVAFRRWALSRPHEYRLVFASAVRGAPEQRDRTCAEAPVEGFGRYFAELMLQVAARYQTPAPATGQLDPGTAAALADAGPDKQAVRALFGAEGGAMMWLFFRCWTRLYGTVTLEVFGHLPPALVSSGAIFVDTMRGVATELGLGDDTERLAGIAAELLAE